MCGKGVETFPDIITPAPGPFAAIPPDEAALHCCKRVAFAAASDGGFASSIFGCSRSGIRQRGRGAKPPPSFPLPRSREPSRRWRVPRSGKAPKRRRIGCRGIGLRQDRTRPLSGGSKAPPARNKFPQVLSSDRKKLKITPRRHLRTIGRKNRQKGGHRAGNRKKSLDNRRRMIIIGDEVLLRYATVFWFSPHFTKWSPGHS